MSHSAFRAFYNRASAEVPSASPAVRVLMALAASQRPLDAYKLARELADLSVMDIGRLLVTLEEQGRVSSVDPKNTANDLARTFVHVRDTPQAWLQTKEDRYPFEFDGLWWFIACEGFSMPQIQGPFPSKSKASDAWRAFWEFQDAMDAN